MRAALIVLAMACLAGCKQNTKKMRLTQDKIVIAHRGASGYLPEHTLAAKKMAFDMGADYLEQDLVLSKDDVPMVIHDIYLDEVTDVATVFPERKRADGRYYVIDFNFDELKTLRAKERFDHQTGKRVYPNRYSGNEVFRLHSFEEEIAFVQQLNASSGKNVGIYPEIKKPAFHKKNGKDISVIVLNILQTYGYTNKTDRCILQCFDASELKRIRTELKSGLFLVQLMESSHEIQLLKAYASYADGVGPWYKMMIADKQGQKFVFTNLVHKAHSLNLVVHPYTFRTDDLGGFDSFEQMVNVLLFEGKADGGFTDFPDTMIEVLGRRNLD